MHTECKTSKEEKGKKCFVRCTRPKEASLTGIGALFAPTPEGRGVTPFSRLFKTSTAQYPGSYDCNNDWMIKILDAKMTYIS